MSLEARDSQCLGTVSNLKTGIRPLQYSSPFVLAHNGIKCRGPTNDTSAEIQLFKSPKPTLHLAFCGHSKNRYFKFEECIASESSFISTANLHQAYNIPCQMRKQWVQRGCFPNMTSGEVTEPSLGLSQRLINLQEDGQELGNWKSQACSNLSLACGCLGTGTATQMSSSKVHYP